MESIQLVISLIDYISLKGIELEFGTDFAIFNRVIKTKTNRHPPARIFVPDQFDSGRVDAFWMVGRNGDDEIIHTQAARLVDLAGESLAEYFGKNFDEVSSNDLDLKNTRYYPGERTANIFGRAVYHGEIWLKPGDDSLRGHWVAPALYRLGLVFAFLKWQPDYAYGIIVDAAMCKGLGARAGYTNGEPASFRLTYKDERPSIEAWLVWMSAADVDYLVLHPPLFLREHMKIMQARRDRGKDA